MNITTIYSNNVNYNLSIILLTKLSYFLLRSLLKNYRRKSKLCTAPHMIPRPKMILKLDRK